MTQNFVYGSQANTLAFRLAQGRLTLTSGTPVTTTDVTAATTIYYTPYQGNQIALYSGGTWQTITFTEVNIAVPASTNQMYDVWGYLSSGALVLEVLAWTNDTTRATNLSTQDGIYIKSGDATRRYLGSFRTTGSSGQTEDSAAKRYVWNYYNRVARSMKVVDATASWTYTSVTVRQARGSTANQLDCVTGVAEDLIFVNLISHASSSASNTPIPGIGLNSTTVNSVSTQDSQTLGTGTATCGMGVNAYFLVTGRNYFPWLESVTAASGTMTWTGIGTAVVCGLTGYLRG